MKVTVQEALLMLQSIGQLDGYKNGDSQVTYKYDASTRLTLAGARRKLRAAGEDYAEARNKIVEEVSGGKGIPQANGDEAVMTMHMNFNRAELSLLRSEIEIDLEPLDPAVLKLDDNPIPPSVLDGLGSFLKL